MDNLLHLFRKRQPLMPQSAQDRARNQVGGKYLMVLADLLYRCDKGSEFADIRRLSEDAQSVYMADVLLWLSIEQRAERVKRVHACDAHAYALADDERETVERQARKDIAQYGGGR
jgi:hypothetical protein